MHALGSTPFSGDVRVADETGSGLVGLDVRFAAEPAKLPALGDHIFGVTITGDARHCGSIVIYAAEDGSGRELDLWLLGPHTSARRRWTFFRDMRTLERLRGQVAGLLRVFLTDPLGRGAVTERLGIGNASDIAALDWSVERRVRFAAEVVEIVAEMHRRSLYVGTWGIGDVLLDDDLRPVLHRVVPSPANPRLRLAPGVPIGCYVAPEVIAGEPPDGPADVYVLGRVLQHLLTDEHPSPSAELLPRLDALADHPAGLARIIRKCTTSSPRLRYPSAKALAKALERHARGEVVGLAHPDVEDGRHRSAVIARSGLANGRIPRRQAPTPLWVQMGHLPEWLSSCPEPSTDEPKATLVEREIAPWRPHLLAAGGILVVSGMIVAYFICTQNAAATLATGLLLAGVAACAGGVPVPERGARLVRAVAAVLAVGLLLVANPAPHLVESGLRHKLASEDMHQRRAAVRGLLARDSADLSELDLSGMTLSGHDFSNRSLRGADLRRSDLSWSDLSGADLTGAELDGAVLDGANMAGASLSGAVAARRARCNALTKLPDGWRCPDASRLLSRAGRSESR